MDPEDTPGTKGVLEYEQRFGKGKDRIRREPHIKEIEESTMCEFKSLALHQRMRSVFGNSNTHEWNDDLI